MIHGLQTKLGLSDAQVAQVKAIFKAQMQQMRALREDDSLSNQDRRAKAAALRQSIRTQIRAILTPDQQKIFDSMPPPRMRGGGPPGEEGGPPPEPPPPPT
jgi:Spy/CpxP family protein refolding chaperone